MDTDTHREKRMPWGARQMQRKREAEIGVMLQQVKG